LNPAGALLVLGALTFAASGPDGTVRLVADLDRVRAELQQTLLELSLNLGRWRRVA